MYKESDNTNVIPLHVNDAVSIKVIAIDMIVSMVIVHM